MVVVPFDEEKHYEQVASWWAGHGWPVLPLEAIPHTGFIVEGVAVGFMYSTDSSIALMEWIVGSPNETPFAIARALMAIIASLQKAARDGGYKMIFTFARHHGLMELYKRTGFQETDKGMTHLVWAEGV